MKTGLITDAMAALKRANRWRVTVQSSKHRIEKLRKEHVEIKYLTKEQKRQVDAVYKKFGYKYNYLTHVLHYSVTGKFDPGILPEVMCRTYLEPKLNDSDFKNVISNKAYFDMLMPDLRFPDTVVRNIAGVLYDTDYNVISLEKARELTAAYPKLVFKPSIDSGAGKSVELVDTAAKDIFSISKSDYLIQLPIVQHPSMAEFNSSSVNVVRVITFMMNDEVIPLMSSFRAGGKGNFTDNQSTKDGRGMVIVGINEDGTLKETGVFSSGATTDRTEVGTVFAGRKISKFDEMVALALKSASKFPNVKLIGWDFVLDANEDIIVMEYNCKVPGVLYYQYNNGPMFGSRTDEIMNYIKSL